MIDGVTIKAGGKDWIVPPLTLKMVKKFAPVMGRIATFTDPVQSVEVMDAMMELIHAAFVRNYPDLTTEAVEDMVDLGNLLTIIQAIMGISGLVASGEAQAVSPFVGETFTASSPQPADGPGTISTS
jgi:hypothetical protein